MQIYLEGEGSGGDTAFLCTVNLSIWGTHVSTSRILKFLTCRSKNQNLKIETVTLKALFRKRLFADDGRYDNLFIQEDIFVSASQKKLLVVPHHFWKWTVEEELRLR